MCGLGRIGSQLVQDLLDQKRWSERGWRRPPKVIVVESRPDNIHISTARDLGAIIVPGSAVDERLLRNIRAERAQHVFFLTGADEVNLEGAADLLKLIRGDVPNKKVIQQTTGERRDFGAVSTPRISVHLNNQELDAVLQLAVEQHVADCQGNVQHETVVARSFNLVDQSIRKMIEEHLIPLRPTKQPARENTQLLAEPRAKDAELTSQAEAIANAGIAPYEVAHFVIVGMGQAGQHLAVTLAHLAHFENLVRPRMTIVYAPHEAEAVAAFQKSYPRLLSQTVMQCTDQRPRSAPDGHVSIDPWMPPPEMDDWRWGVHVADTANPHESDCGVAFVANGGLVELPGSLTSDEFIQPLIHLSLSPGVRTFVFVCRSTDDINCSEAIELRDEIDDRIKSRTSQGGLAYSHRDHAITVFGYVPERRMLTRLVSRSRLNADLVLFGDCYESCRLEDLTNDISCPLAEEIAHSYAVKAWRRKMENQQAQGSQGGTGVTASEFDIPRTRLQSLRPWERQSNLWAAAHLNVKLAAIGKRLVPRINRAQPAASPVTLDESSRLLLAKMEHNRYLAERLMAGWAFGKRAIPENKRRFAFVDWDHLGNHEWVKDLDQIEIILAFLRNHPDIVLDDLH
ncbi:MAG TPA: NAD-binding protein [Pirellulaceae bacterium]|nr:NAD-binding protein [Pirellulaceae bacterium]